MRAEKRSSSTSAPRGPEVEDDRFSARIGQFQGSASIHVQQGKLERIGQIGCARKNDHPRLLHHVVQKSRMIVFPRASANFRAALPSTCRKVNWNGSVRSDARGKTIILDFCTTWSRSRG